ncbi:MAG TPA: S-methyl-5'-thioadenosine phosphorylase [Polyangia bacterium]
MIGIIGGTGLGDTLGSVGKGATHTIDTPFGRPSAPILTTEIGGTPVALLSRHGEGHILNPSQVPYQANIFALKELGVTQIIASGAVGSLREAIAPRDLVLPDQVIDRTFRRPSTFFDGLAVHVEMAAPFCPALRAALTTAAASASAKVHLRGTYVCMEGPQFSSRAESEMHRQWGGDLIGMTLMPEAKLAREAEICYAAVALSTDYDCWRPHPAAVDQINLLEEIIGNVNAATQNALSLIRSSLPAIAALPSSACTCQKALQLAIWSDRKHIPREARDRLAPLIAKYVD